MTEPSYIKLYNSGELRKRAEIAYNILNSCNCCPHDCRVNRFDPNEKLGKCLSRAMPIVSAYTPHFGEEPVLTGIYGAGNIFFGNCNLKCMYCQNYEISQNYKVEKHNEISFERLADIMLELQELKCHNIGLVSPSHFSGLILKSLYTAVEKGLCLPIIYNTNAYDSVEILKLYDDIIDIYLPDLKYGDNVIARKYSMIDSYFDRAKEAIKEMFRQVGDELVYDGSVVVRGLIIRHLVLPNNLSESENVFRFIAEELSPNIHISLMSQYNPAHYAKRDALINRKLRESEYEKAIALMEQYGLRNGWFQEMESSTHYNPEFQRDRINPFGN